MPVISAGYDELVGLIGRRIPKEELVARVPMMGGAYEGEDAAGRLLFEFFPNRPDLLSIEGLARACRAFFDVKPGLPEFSVEASDETVTIEKSVRKIRPVIAFARVDGLAISDDRLAQLIELQERLTVGPGRKRRKVAIGIHDAAPVKGPFVYKAVGRDEVRFVPLAATQAMTPAEVLERHEKGRAYAPLLAGADKVPLIVDSGGQVLSMPPVINGALTALTTRTRDVLVDVTGTDERAVLGLLNIVVTSLAERGGRIRGFQVVQDKKTRLTPDLTPIETKLPYARAQGLLGIAIGHEEAKKYLGRMGHDAVPEGTKAARVRSPAYRMDLLHPDDLVEDLGIGYGFERFDSRLPERALFGGVRGATQAMRRARTLLLGLGFTEVLTLTVSGRRDVFELAQAPPHPVVEVTNPITVEQAILRPRLLPGLLSILRANKHRELPQSIFETGFVVPSPDGGAKKELRAAAARISANANFSESKGLLLEFLRGLGVEAKIEAGTPPGYQTGRAGIARDAAGAEVGHFGELPPAVVTGFELGAPVVAFEVRLSSSAPPRPA